MHVLSGILFYLVHDEIYMTLKQTDALFIYSSQCIRLNIAVLVKERYCRCNNKLRILCQFE